MRVKDTFLQHAPNHRLSSFDHNPNELNMLLSQEISDNIAQFFLDMSPPKKDLFAFNYYFKKHLGLDSSFSKRDDILC